MHAHTMQVLSEAHGFKAEDVTAKLPELQRKIEDYFEANKSRYCLLPTSLPREHRLT